MAPGISYDDSGSLASYFGVTFLALILVPGTYVALKPSKKASLKPLCPCGQCQDRPNELAKRKDGNYGLKAALILGWALFAYLCYKISQAPKLGQTVYNPFEILGLSDSSTEKAIKKHYKKLSLQLYVYVRSPKLTSSHPDKIKLAENQTKEDADAKFVELTKAYKSLTDEVTRENLAKYGNPDGPQQREDKIAIPQWVVEGKNNVWILGAYGLVLGGFIPFVVGRWWFSQRSLTRDGVLNGTAELFFHYLRDDTDILSLISLLSCALELVPLLASKKSSKKERKERQGAVDKLEKELDTKREALGIDEDPVMKKESRVGVTSAASKRARALLWAHLLRVDLPKELQDEQLAVLRKTPVLLNALMNISLAHNWLSTSLSIVKLQAALVQALPVTSSPLVQLPKVTHTHAEELEIVEEIEGRRWAEKIVKKDLLEDEAKSVLEKWPRLEITDAKFQVTGESEVTPSAIVQLVFDARYVFPDSKRGTEEIKEKAESSKEAQPNGYAHAPRWPQLRKPHFQVLLGDSKLDKVIVQPIKISDLPMPAADGTLSAPRRFELQFQAPPEPNLYSFVLHAVSDTFLGSDVSRPIMLKVEQPSEESDVEDDDYSSDDISDPEEDTLAGQMAMMRGGKVKPSAVHDSDSEEEEEEVVVDRRAGKAINEDSSDDDA